MSDAPSAPLHVHPVVIRMQHTDAAGVMFFASQFELAHEAFEATMDAHGLPLSRVLTAESWGLPVVHAEGDYAAPLRLGDAVDIEVHVARVGGRSFTLRCVLRRPAGEVVGEVRTTHAAIDRGAWRPIELPDVVRGVLGSR